MSNTYFRFKQFTVHQDHCAMKVTTDACLYGAWLAKESFSQKLVADSTAANSILDIGAGCGLLSLIYAQAHPDSHIDGIEIDKAAADQAAKNIASSPWADRIDIFQGDARHFSFNRTYDVIIANPPFYENELVSGNEQKNIAHHSSQLFLGDLLQIIKTRLAASGIFFLLLPYKRKDEITSLLKKNDLFISKSTGVRQSEDHPYFRVMIAGNRNAGMETEECEISIKDSQGVYTPAFMRLLKDYYLYL